PKGLPQPEYVTVPVNTKETAQPAKVVQAPKTTSKPAPAPDTHFKTALATQQQSKGALDKATQELALATTGVADAQKARDALRPKITQAEAESVQADKRAGSGPDLLAAGAISAKRAEEVKAEKEAAKKALDDLKARVSEADKALTEAQAR